MTLASPTSSFLDLVRQRIVFLDGAMGTSVHTYDLPLSEYQGLENCTEILTLTRPDVIEEIHRSFFEAGADAVETNTFGANKIVLAEFDLVKQTRELNVRAAQIARQAADAFSTPERPRFVVGSIGPGTRLISLRQTDYDTMLDSYREQILGLVEGGCDVLLIETCQDILQVKVAIQAARLAFEQLGKRLPLMCQVTMETTGTMLVGTDMPAAITALEAFPDVDVIGMNCATGPQEMSEHVRVLAESCSRLLSVLPNAGLPQLVDGAPHFPLSPEEMARWLKEFVEADGVNIVGGCCGTTPSHIKALVDTIGHRAPTPRKPVHEPASSSLYATAPHRQANSFLIVGERCNTNGSRKFKQLLEAGDIEGMTAMGVEQVKEGAHVLDVCVDYVGREGAPDMKLVIDRFARDVSIPLMLDSTQADVLEAGLKLASGKCIINSVNLEDGEKRLDEVCPMLRQYGAAVVALTIDEDPQEAMAKTAERKLEIASRLHDLLTRKHGIPEEDIFFDCLTFPITTGNSADRRLGLETLDGIEAVMTRFPRCQSILGVSNVSFGLVPAARVVLNSAFLAEACARGLTAAIVHASKILPRNQISEERWNAALDLIYDRGENGEALEKFIGLFSKDERLGEKVAIESLPIDQRLKQRIIDGARVGLEQDLDEAMKEYPPLEIINTLLLDGMKVVGELFGSGQMQLPFVLKSAEVMKSAVAHLEPHMEKLEGSSRGKVILATVRGDVHDIGKNLVDIILSNNGFTVYNLGIKQPVSSVIAALKEHNADVIGLSGLLVKSTLVMRDDLAVLNEQNIDVPVILGGAALTRKYVEADLRAIYNGRLDYAKDAFEGLRLVREICEGPAAEKRAADKKAAATAAADAADEQPTPPTKAAKSSAEARPAERSMTAAQVEQATVRRLAEEAEQRFGLSEVPDSDEAPATGPLRPAANVERQAESEVATLPRSDIAHTVPVPQPPFWGARVIEHVPLKAVLGYMNEVMLFQVQWSFRKRGRTPEEFKRYIDTEVRPIYRQLVERCIAEEILRPQAVYGYWPCNADGDDLVIFAPPAEHGAAADAHGPELLRFSFPRQRKAPHWCLSDFWRPLSDGVADVAAFQIVTVGRQVSAVARDWFAQNEYQQYLFLHGLGVESAEALAEYLHKQVRAELGIAGQDARELRRLFQQGYQGSRYSFGYPACPRLEDQAKLMTLLKPERIEIELSDEYQLEPEQSTSAIISYHPEARYFNVR